MYFSFCCKCSRRESSAQRIPSIATIATTTGAAIGVTMTNMIKHNAIRTHYESS
jgi:hypothetical protein